MEGYLYKWVNCLYGYKSRYFVLKHNILYYFIKKGEKAKGRIHIGIASVRSTTPLKFEIDTGMGKIFLKSSNNSEQKEWVSAIKRAKDEFTQSQNIAVMNSSCFNEYISKGDKIMVKLQELNLSLENLSSNYKDLSLFVEKNMELSKDSQKISIDFRKTEEIVKSHFSSLKSSIEGFTGDVSKLLLQASSDKISKSNENVCSVQTNFRPVKCGDINSDHNLIENNEKNNLSPEKGESVLYKEIIEQKPQQNIDVINQEDEVFYAVNEVLIHSKRNSHVSINRKPSQIENDQLIVFKEEENIFYDKHYVNKRSSLPQLKSKAGFKIWDILKDSVGKDLSKFSVPVCLNEPLSMLQRLCENFQYSDLLNKAAVEPNSLKRLALVACFCLGGYSSSIHRTNKPFNPLLGETYEYIDDQLKFRFLAEQVSHHPPISACYAEGEHYTYYTNSNAKTKFNLFSSNIEIHPMGRSFVTFKNYNQTIWFTKPKARVKNLIVGKLYLECFDSVNVVNISTGETCVLEIMQEGYFSKKEKGRVKGYVKDSNEEIRLNIEGNMYSDILINYDDKNGNKKEIIYTNIKGDSEENYYFTDFTINLNNLPEEMKEVIAPTDSRLRPDQQALENGDLEKASAEKNRLEEKQRKTRKENEKKHIAHKAAYFEETYDEVNGEVIYKYSRDYFNDRKNNDFSHLPMIY